MTKTFICAACGETYPRAWSDEEARAESTELFGAMVDEDLAVVCDRCWKEMGLGDDA